jgi:hypothetical protein
LGLFWEREGMEDASGDSRQEFVYDLLEALDRRRAAVDARCAVVFAIAGAAFALFITQLKSGELLYPGRCIWKLAFCSIILSLLSISMLLGLSLIAPISTPKARPSRSSIPLSWFYQIADLSEEDYHRAVMEQDKESILRESSGQVVKISRLLKKRYDRLKWTCYFLYWAIISLALYACIILIN